MDYSESLPSLTNNNNTNKSLASSPFDVASYSTLKDTLRFHEVHSDTGAGDNCASFVQRMAACKSTGKSDLPMAHLAFLMKKNPRSTHHHKTTSGDGPSSSGPPDVGVCRDGFCGDKKDAASVAATPNGGAGSTPDRSKSSNLFDNKAKSANSPGHRSIHESTFGRSVQSSLTFPENEETRSTTNTSQTHYLESLASPNRSPSRTSDATTKSAKSEAWQAFLAKKRRGGDGASRPASRSRAADEEVRGAAELLASSKVDELMSSLNQSDSSLAKKKHVSEMLETLSNTSSITRSHAERFLAQRDKIALNRSSSKLRNRSRSKSRSSSRPRTMSAETAKAAEKLASERVEAMMSAMSEATLDM